MATKINKKLNKTYTKDEINSMDTCEVKRLSTSLFLNKDVRDYALYVLETRALPNIMDGMRLGARKILWAAMTGELKTKSVVKMPSLSGDTLKLMYHHGDVSLMNTIVQLSSEHVMKYHPLQVIGQYPSLRVPECDTAARYLEVMKTLSMDMYRTDAELFEFIEEDGIVVQPRIFLPIVPTTLLYRTNAPGFGFSFRSMSYSLESIIDNCIRSLTFGTCTNQVDAFRLQPEVDGIESSRFIYNESLACWYNIGNYKIDTERDTLTITDLPFDVPFEKFELQLQKLVDKAYCMSYKNKSLNGNIEYIVSFAKGRLRTLVYEQWKFFKNFKLYSKVKPDVLNVLDEDGKTILFYESAYHLIDAFIQKRLKYYDRRKTKTTIHIENNIVVLSNKIKFVKLVVGNKIKINNRPIEDVRLDLDKYALPHDMLKMNIEKLTNEEIAKMEADIVKLKNELTYIKKTSIQDMYLRDLIYFRIKYCGVDEA